MKPTATIRTKKPKKPKPKGGGGGERDSKSIPRVSQWDGMSLSEMVLKALESRRNDRDVFLSLLAWSVPIDSEGSAMVRSLIRAICEKFIRNKQDAFPALKSQTDPLLKTAFLCGDDLPLIYGLFLLLDARDAESIQERDADTQVLLVGLDAKRSKAFLDAVREFQGKDLQNWTNSNSSDPFQDVEAILDLFMSL